jgi:glycerol-3-phosphate acyltransferase PlsY
MGSRVGSMRARTITAVETVAWALVVPAYVLGTFPTAILVGRRVGVDPTLAGSGNPGASNTYRTAGRRAAALVLAGDVGKGIVATAVGLIVSRPLGVACGLAAVLGHVLPITRGLQGGRGVATAAGMAAVLHPLPSLVLAAVWCAVAAVSRTASVASITIAGLLPVVAGIAGAAAWEVAALAGVSVVVIARHRQNIGRLVHGRERELRSPDRVG